jgi:hypothetical protein
MSKYWLHSNYHRDEKFPPLREKLMIKPTRTVLRTLTLISVSLLLAACVSGPPTPTVDYKTDYNFTAVKKIAFYHDSGQVFGNNPLQLSDMQRDRINEALSYALTNRGFQMVTDAAQADLLLSWNLVTQQMTDVQSWGTLGMGYGGYYGLYGGYNCWGCFPSQDISVRNYTQGTFIVDMIDPKLNKSVWRGVTQSPLKGNEREDQGKYNEAATAIFAPFPP